MTKKDWPKVVGTLLASVLLFILMTYMGVTNGFLKVLVVGLLVLSFFADKFGGTGRTIRKIFLAVAAVLFLLSWWFTRPTAKWAQHRTEEILPRDNFDPRVEKPVAQVRFYERPDGVVERASVDWRINPVTGEPLARPGTTEFLRLLTLYEVQKAKEKAPAAIRCTYCQGRACETMYPATILGGGHMELRSPEHGTTTDFRWNLNGKGAWKQDFPKSGGTVEWLDAKYEAGVLRGIVRDTMHTPNVESWAAVLTCNGEIPLPNS